MHVSGVDENLPFDDMPDDHRVLVTDNDRLETCRQVAGLVSRGYAGPISYEPFSPALLGMPRQELIALLRTSAEYVHSKITLG